MDKNTMIVFCVIWIGATIAACVTKNPDAPFGAAVGITVLLGLGWMIFKREDF